MAFLSLARLTRYSAGGDRRPPSIYHTRRGSFKGGAPGRLPVVSSPAVKDRRIWALLAFLCLLLPMLLAAQGERTPPPAAPAPTPAPVARPSVVLEGREIAVPVTLGPSGPMFGLTPLAES